MITLTPQALAQVKHLLEQSEQKNNKKPLGLRISVKNRGCSGKSYTLDYVFEQNPNDDKLEQSGVTIFIEKSAALFLFGTTMDYEENKTTSGFTFTNPNAKGHCGCGESFYV